MAQHNLDDEEWEPAEEWKPPTEAEKKVLQARRERSDKISKLMGDYLLKGYKMLGTSCGTCGTILLRSKQNVDYCVACVELDSDTVKDDPALNQEAARKQAAEQSQREGQVEAEDLEHPLAPRPALRPDSNISYNTTSGYTLPLRSGHLQAQGATGQMAMDGDEKPCYSISDLPPTEMSKPALSDVRSRTPISPVQSDEVRAKSQMIFRESVLEPLRHSIQSVEDKMTWASRELAESKSVEYSKQVCELIRICAETLIVLSALQSRKPETREDS